MIEYCRQLPTEAFVHNGVIRKLAREIGKPYLPPSIVDEQRFGFSRADAHWRFKRRLPEFREELREAKENPDIAELIDFDEVERRLEDYPDEIDSLNDYIRYSYGLAPVVITARFVNWATGRNLK